MSQFYTDAFSRPDQGDQQQQRPESPPDFLTPAERATLQRNLSFPEDFPREFKSWLTDYLSTVGLDISISQVRGFGNTQPKIGTSGDTSGTTSGTYVSVGGASISDLAAGQYLFLFGFQRSDLASGSGAGYLAPSFDGSTPSDAEAAVCQGTGSQGHVHFATRSFGGGGHDVELKARTDGGAERDFAGTWIIALKFGN